MKQIPLPDYICPLTTSRKGGRVECDHDWYLEVETVKGQTYECCNCKMVITFGLWDDGND